LTAKREKGPITGIASEAWDTTLGPKAMQLLRNARIERFFVSELISPS
jgi:hypothetical protein